MKYIYPLEPNADITEGLDDRIVDMLLNHRDKINEVVEAIDSYFHIEEPESRLTTTEVQQIEMANDLRELLRPNHKEGESYTTTLKRLLSSPEKKEETKMEKIERIYGKDFGVKGDIKLETFLKENGYNSLAELLKDRKQETTQELDRSNLLTFEEMGYLLSRYLYEDSEIYRRVKSKIEKLLK